jgi:uncharacterized integral membrane protein
VKAKTILIGILIVLSLVVIFQNTEVVGFKLLFWTFSMSRIIWLIGILVIGFIIGFAAGTMRRK